MKKLFLLLSFVAFTQMKAQIVNTEKPITIGKIAPMGQLNVTIEKFESDSEYVITYRDVKFTKIMEYKSFKFKDENNDFNNLYDLITEGLKNLLED